MPVHYTALGTVSFLVLLLLEKNFAFSGKNTSKILITYHMGFNIMQLFFLICGLTQVLGMELSSMVDASISGFGRIMIGATLVILLNQIRKKVEV